VMELFEEALRLLVWKTHQTLVSLSSHINLKSSVISKWRWASQKGSRMAEKKKVELVKVDANSDTQKVLEQLKAVLEKQGFKIKRKNEK